MIASVDPAFRRGSRFVERHGDPLARARLAALVDGHHGAALREALAGRQEPDGRLRRPTASGSAVQDGLWGLAILADLGLLDAPEAERLVGFLSARQEGDGSWGGATARERLVVAAHLAGFLARSRHARLRVLEAAASFVGVGWDPELVRSGDAACILAFGHFFACNPHELADGALQWCGRELERSFRAARLDAPRTSRAFTLADVYALPGTRLSASEVVAALQSEQDADGGWAAASACSVDARVGVTLDALLGLRRLAC